MKAKILTLIQILGNISRKGEQAYWAMASQIVAGAAGFLTSVILIRELGLEEFGQFSIAALIIVIVKNFAEGLVFAPMVSIGPKISDYAIISYRGFVLFKALAFFIIAAIIVWLILIFASYITHSSWLLQSAPIVAFATATSGLSDFFRRHQFLIGAPARSFGLEALRYTLQLGSLVAIAYFALQYLSASNAILIVAFSALCSAFFGYTLFGRWNLKQRMTRAAVVRHWNFTRWMLPSLVFETVQSNFPLLYTTSVMGEAALGIVRVVQQIAALLNLPINALAQVAPAMSARIFSNNGYLETQKYLILTGRIMTALAIALSLAILLISNTISKYLEINDQYTFTILLFLFNIINVLNATRFSNLILVNTIEHTRPNLTAAIAGATVAVIFSVMLLNIIGLYVVPVALSLVAIANWIVIYRYLKIHEKIVNYSGQ